MFTCDLWKNKCSNVEQTEDGLKRKLSTVLYMSTEIDNVPKIIKH